MENLLSELNSSLQGFKTVLQGILDAVDIDDSDGDLRSEDDDETTDAGGSTRG